MIVINFSPIAGDLEPLASVGIFGYAVTINGETFDFTPLVPGHELPLDAIGSAYFADKAAMSIDGVLEITLLMPYHEATATDAIRFPEPLTVTADGPVDIPTNHPAVFSEHTTIEDGNGLLTEQEDVH